MTRFTGAARTHQGLKRENNQDAWFMDEKLGLFLVADGMGGLAHGEVASALVSRTMADYVAHFHDKPIEDVERYDWYDSGFSLAANTLMQAIHLANRAVYDSSRAGGEKRMMGSTLVCFLAEAEDLIMAHVGDSKIFRLREGGLTQLTVDHSLASDPLLDMINKDSTIVSSLGNTLTRAMGIKGEVKPDMTRLTVEDGDLFLLCTDGLTDMVDSSMIARVLGMDMSGLGKKADHLVELALAGGGRDNITVMLVAPRSLGRSVRGLIGRLARG